MRTTWLKTRVLFFLCLAVPCVATAGEAEKTMISVSAIWEAKGVFEKADKKTLVIFDVDSTLTQPSNPYFQRKTVRRYKAFYKAQLAPLTKYEQLIFDHLFVLQSPSVLVEEGFPALIEALQQRGVKTIAYTAAKTGPLGTILPSFPEWRYQELKQLGIDFSQSFPNKVLFKAFSDFGGGHPGMENGIVYSGHQVEKGEIIGAVLDAMHWQPKTVIFVDDKERNLTSMLGGLKKQQPEVGFLGIHYQGVERTPEVETDEIQFQEKIIALVEQAKKIASETTVEQTV